MAKETTAIDSGVLKKLIECIDKLRRLLVENQSREIDGIVAAFQELPYDIDIRVSRENWDGTSSASITSRGNCKPSALTARPSA